MVDRRGPSNFEDVFTTTINVNKRYVIINIVGVKIFFANIIDNLNISGLFLLVIQSNLIFL